MTILSRILAGQFAQPSGWLGRRLIGPWLDRIGKPMNRLTLTELDVRPSDDVLEVGFGGGGLLQMILDQTSGQVTGVDLSAAMVKRGRSRFRARPGLRLLESSVEVLPMASDSVDKACSVNNLYFWPNPQAGMAELARVVRPGGSLSICFEPPEELKKWPGHRFGFRLYEEPEVRSLMAEAGFGHFRLVEGFGHKPDFFLCLTGERLQPSVAKS